MVGRDQFFEQSALRTRCRSAACLHLRRRSRGSAAVGTCAPESSRAEVNKSSASKDLVHVRPHPGPLSSPPTGGAADRLGETPWGNPHQDPNRGVAPLVGSFPTRPAPSQALTRLRQRILHLRWQTYPLRAPPSQLADFPWGGFLLPRTGTRQATKQSTAKTPARHKAQRSNPGFVKNVRFR